MRLKNKRSIQILNCAVLLFFLTTQSSNALAPSRNILVPIELTQHSFGEPTLFFWFFPEPVFTTLFFSLYLVTYFVEGEKIREEQKINEIRSELTQKLSNCRTDQAKIICRAIAKQLEIPIRGTIQQHQAFLDLSYKLLQILFFLIFLSIPSVSYFLWKNTKEVFSLLLFFFGLTLVEAKLNTKKSPSLPITPIPQNPFPVIDLAGHIAGISV